MLRLAGDLRDQFVITVVMQDGGTFSFGHGRDQQVRQADRPHAPAAPQGSLDVKEIRRFKPSTVSRRFSVVAGFYRTCALDGILQHSPAEHVRRPAVPAESPTLGFTHLQFEALLTAARESANPCDFALVAMLGLLGLRIFEATSADLADRSRPSGRTGVQGFSAGMSSYWLAAVRRGLRGYPR